jgi:RsiW-degrading membrane proteinase PrsW (M82 family)
MLSVIPAGLMEWWLIPDDTLEPFSDIGAVAAAMFFIVGPVDEFSKFLAVRVGVYRTHYLREPLDGLIYGAAASLGFATAENVLYALTYGPEVMIVRGPLSTAGHVVFGSLWAVTLDQREGRKAFTLLQLAGLAGAAVLHGTFNVLAFTSTAWGVLLAMLLVAVGVIAVFRMMRWTRERSIYHLRRNVPHISCTRCTGWFRLGDNFCPQCGNSAETSSGEIACANCGNVCRPGAKFCSGCGDLFVESG